MAPTYSIEMDTIGHMKKNDGGQIKGDREDLVRDQPAGLPKTGLTGDVLLMPYAPVGAKRTRVEQLRAWVTEKHMSPRRESNP